MSTPFWKSYQFYVLLAAFVAFVYKYFFPTAPVSAEIILTVFMTLLGLVGIVPTLRMGLVPAGTPGIFGLQAFWVGLVGLLGFIAFSFFPNFPLNTTELLAVVTFILSFFGIKPELRVRGLLK